MRNQALADASQEQAEGTGHCVPFARTVFQGAMFGVVIYLATCSLTEQSWRTEKLAVAFVVGILVNAITLAIACWLGSGLKMKSAGLSAMIASFGYTAILAVAISLAFVRLPLN